MWHEDQIQSYLKKSLTKQRYEHCLRVRDVSIELAKVYGEDINKAKIAGLVHDCAKNLSDNELLRILGDEGVIIEDILLKQPQINHGLAGSIIAKKTMGIEDEFILDAITYHTTGRANMTLLEKIIYIADLIEPMRNFKGIEELRELTYRDLDEALLLSFNETIKFVISKGQLLHINTIEARNYILYSKL